MTDGSRSALILIAYVNDWHSPVVRERADGSSAFIGTRLDG